MYTYEMAVWSRPLPILCLYSLPRTFKKKKRCFVLGYMKNMETKLFIEQCRSCLTDVNEKLSLINEEIECKLKFCLKYKFLFSENVPYICTDCTNMLEVCYKFINICIESDLKLSRYSKKKDNLQFNSELKPVIIKDVLDDCQDYELSNKEQFNYSQEQLAGEEIHSETEVKLEKKTKVKKKQKKDFLCPQCEQVFITKCTLYKHIETHTTKKTQLCKECPKRFSNKYTLKQHEIVKHVIDLKKIEKNDTLKTLLKRKLVKNACHICDFVCSSAKSLQSHIRNHGNAKYKCEHCRKELKSKYTLKMHMLMKHFQGEKTNFDNYICDYCNKSFLRKKNLIVHLRVHTGFKPYKCKYCPCSFTQHINYKNHERLHTGERPFLCIQCGKSFSSNNGLRTHRTVHIDDRNYSCKLCNKSMKTSKSLSVHMQNMHLRSNKVICDLCGFSFSTKGNMKIHRLKAHSELSGLCQICNKNYPFLKEHTRTKHLQEKKFECNICKLKFTRQSNLSTHIKHVHTEKNKFKCTLDHCDLGFPTMSKLKYHIMKFHTKETVFRCSNCDRGFIRMNDFKFHLRVSHGIESEKSVRVRQKKV